jgi:hybrid cluster-associated redox disulfide protein
MPSKKLNQDNTQKELVNVKKDANLADVVFKYPDVAEVLMDYGLHCVGCIASSFDTIEAGAKVHGLSDSEIDEMLERINEVINFAE